MQEMNFRLLDISTLSAQLVHILTYLSREGVLKSEAERWYRVGTLLFPPTSLVRVDTDASAADPYDAWMYCAPAAQYDSDQSQLLNDYVLQLVRFHFVWNAFEVASSCFFPKHVINSKDRDDQRSNSMAIPAAHRQVMASVHANCLVLARGVASADLRLKQGEGLGFLRRVGENMEAFRNYIFHGQEDFPAPEDLRKEFKDKLDGEGVLSVKAYRLIYFTRLTLHMIQALALIDLKKGATVPVNEIQFLSSWHDYEFEIPCKFVINSASVCTRRMESPLSANEVELLAEGCEVPRELIEILCNPE